MKNIQSLTFADSQCDKGRHDWEKIVSFKKVWYLIFIYINERDEKLVCNNCGKEVRV